MNVRAKDAERSAGAAKRIDGAQEHDGKWRDYELQI